MSSQVIDADTRPVTPSTSSALRGASPEKTRAKSAAGRASPLAGTLWIAGWLFTIGFVKLVWWKVLLGLLVWPYFLGEAVR